MDISLSRVHFPVTTLGPGQRLGIWLQGCPIRCPGCISVDTWAPDQGEVPLAGLLEHITPWLHQADGITISGGEPFAQPAGLIAMLRAIRDLHSGDVLVYSGYPLEAIQETLRAAEGLIDALITDPFEIHSPQTLALRGSDNQRLHLLTAKGRERLACYERTLVPADKVLDVMFDPDGTIWFAGIPRRHDFIRLRTLLESQGHTLTTTDDRSVGID